MIVVVFVMMLIVVVIVTVIVVTAAPETSGERAHGDCQEDQRQQGSLRNFFSSFHHVTNYSQKDTF